MQPSDLVLAPPEQAGPGRIDAGEIAVEIGDAEKIFGHLPDAVAFTNAFGDFGFEPVVEDPQRLLLADALGGLDAGGQDTADAVRRGFVRDRAVADRKPRVLGRRAAAADRPRVIDGKEGPTLAAQVSGGVEDAQLPAMYDNRGYWTGGVSVSIDEQSPDIAMGVDKSLEMKEGLGHDDFEQIGAAFEVAVGLSTGQVGEATARFVSRVMAGQIS